MRPLLSLAASDRHGLFTRAQALAAGYTSREIKANIRPGGPWIAVRVGVYAERALIDSLSLRDRWRYKDRAALLMSHTSSVLSHDSAARFLDIPLLEVEVPGSHTTRLGTAGCRTTAGVTRHRDKLPLCVETVDGLLCTSYARTALDVARLHGYRHGVVAIDNVRNRGVPLEQLTAEFERMRRHPHAARVRAALDASDAGAESPLESLGRELVAELGLGEVETQVAVRLSDGGIAWCDVLVGCHVFECHGFIKLLGPREGGVAKASPAQVVREQQRRRTAICAQGLGMSDIEWSDCFGAARERAKDRLRREYAVTEARFGRELPPALREFANSHLRPRRRLWTADQLDDVA